MKLLRTYLFVLIAVLTLAFQIAWTRTAHMAVSASVAEISPRNQVVPTLTPQVETTEEVLMTNPALLQAIILLGIVAVLVIFVGVWINRRKIDLR